MSKLHKNAIITGCIDSYCLVCESHLRSEEDASSHIEKPVHKKNLDSTRYLESHKNDRIRKVKKGYFCEFCNVLFSMEAKAILHISNTKHTTNRGFQLLRRVGNSIISCNDVIINEKAWNGIIDNTCAICNMEFFSEHIHKTEKAHALNLVQKEVVFDADGNIYRKIDESSYQCLICNMIFAMATVTTHFVGDDHKKRLMQCREFQQPFPSPEIKYSNDAFFNEAAQTASVVKKTPEIKCAAGNKTDATADTGPTFGNNTKNSQTKSQNNNLLEPSLTKKQTGKSEIPEDVKHVLKATDNEGDKNFEKVQKMQREKDIFTQNDTPKAQNCNINNAGDNTTKSAKVDAITQYNVESTGKKLCPEKVTNKTNNVRTGNINGDAEIKERKEQSNKQHILENVSEFQKQGININFETQTASCKKCTVNLDLNYETIVKHIEDHKNKPNNPLSASTFDPNFSRTILKSVNVKQDKTPNDQEQSNKIDENHNIKNDSNKKPNIGLKSENITDKPIEKTAIPNGTDYKVNEDRSYKELITYLPPNANHTTNEATTKPLTKNENKDDTEDDPICFAKANKLTYNKGNNVAFCRLCDSRIPSSFRSMKEHVAGAAHKIRASKAPKPAIPKRSMKQFIKTKIGVESMYEDDMVINDRYCLTKLSFLMITEHGNRLRCQVCEVNLLEPDVDNHAESMIHEMAMNNTSVVRNLDSEFVREVRPGLFHCGFCNLIVGCWEDVSKHLACEEHRTNRCEAGRRLREHMPSIHNHRQMRERHIVDMLRCGVFGPFF